MQATSGGQRGARRAVAPATAPRSTTITTAICYDLHDSDIADRLQGVDLLLALVNDAPFGDFLPTLHAQDIVYRAIENRVAIVTSATTGPTLAVYRYGRIIGGPLPTGVEASLFVKRLWLVLTMGRRLTSGTTMAVELPGSSFTARRLSFCAFWGGSERCSAEHFIRRCTDWQSQVTLPNCKALNLTQDSTGESLGGLYGQQNQ